MRTKSKRFNERGNAMLELAVVVPVLLLVMLGTADLGRVFFAAVTAVGGAHSGALYGSMSVARASDSSGVTNAALLDTQDLSGTTVAVTKYCQCGLGTPAPCPMSCSTSSPMRVYVKVTTQKTYSTVAPYPGIPASVPLATTAVFRVR